MKADPGAPSWIKPDATTCNVAAEMGAELIVVGSTGMRGARRGLGSAPNSVAHHARCDVLRPRGHGGGGRCLGSLNYRRRDAASSAVVLTFHMLSVTWTVTPGGRSGRCGQQIARQVDAVGRKVAVQVLHGAGADDRGGDRGVPGSERDCHLDECQSGLVGECAERVCGV